MERAAVGSPDGVSVAKPPAELAVAWLEVGREGGVDPGGGTGGGGAIRFGVGYTEIVTIFIFR